MMIAATFALARARAGVLANWRCAAGRRRGWRPVGAGVAARQAWRSSTATSTPAGSGVASGFEPGGGRAETGFAVPARGRRSIRCSETVAGSRGQDRPAALVHAAMTASASRTMLAPFRLRNSSSRCCPCCRRWRCGSPSGSPACSRDGAGEMRCSKAVAGPSWRRPRGAMWALFVPIAIVAWVLAGRRRRVPRRGLERAPYGQTPSRSAGVALLWP